MRVEVIALTDDWRHARLLLPLDRNCNPGGSMFGGAVACLADPVAALACNRLFPGHQVWTRSLNLDFRREGRSDLELRFDFEPAQEQAIALELRRRSRATPEFEYGFYDTDGRVCVTVGCRVAIRPADYQPTTSSHRSEKRDE
jgi:acyl-coenzyme A thioesterase PaaI-like protein